MRIGIVASMIVLLGVMACEKKDEVTHLNGLVTNNDVPIFYGVSIVLINNYINRYHIDLLGVQPSDTVLAETADTLSKSPSNVDLRASFLAEAIENDLYFERFFSLTSLKFIEGLERPHLEARQVEYEAIRASFAAEGDSLRVQYFEYEIIKIDSLIQSSDRFRLQEISLKEYFRSFIYNGIYDDINMGTFNFVQSCFENLLGRGPTADELDRGMKMVEGKSTYVFLTGGNSKSDFIDIMLDSPEFLVGRVQDVYEQLVQRKPTSSEQVIAVQLLQGKKNVKELQVSVAKTKDYAGF
jgi:hypothetical protein